MRPVLARSRLAGLLLAMLLAGLPACRSAEAPATATLPAPTAQPPTAAPPAATTTIPATATLSGPIYDNPVYPADFPDPFVLPVGDTYYAYSTTSGSANIPMLRSTDLARWERLGDALPALPKWAAVNRGFTWAPGAIQIGDTFVLYYTARDVASDRQCVSRAVSPTPEGPFADELTAPLVCQVDLGGSIDPYPFQDTDGQLYLLWKNDGNCCGKPVGLWVQALSADGLSLAGEPTQLILRDQAWERPLIENPAMVKNGGKYYLFYSANRWESHQYAVGYAVCDTITGPCVKPQSKPIFSFTPEALGPGGEAFFVDAEGDLWMAYHAWIGATVGYPSGQRALFIDPVTFVNDKPVITGPTSDPQPLP